MISIYISYELIHACLCPPRIPIAHAGLLSFLKIASVQFSFGHQYEFIVGRLEYRMLFVLLSENGLVVVLSMAGSGGRGFAK